MLPATATCSCYRPVGSIQRHQLRIALPIDRTSWDKSADAGTKQWLLARALQGGQEGNGGSSSSGELQTSNPYASYGDDDDDNQGKVAEKLSNNKVNNDDDDTLPEDKFHIQLPNNVDKYTGQELPYTPTLNGLNEESNNNTEELPEDRFHKKDASSSYIINQREEALKSKWDKYEK